MWIWYILSISIIVKGWCDGEQLNEVAVPATRGSRCKDVCALNLNCTHAIWDKARAACFMMRGCASVVPDYPTLRIFEIRSLSRD